MDISRQYYGDCPHTQNRFFWASWVLYAALMLLAWLFVPEVAIPLGLSLLIAILVLMARTNSPGCALVLTFAAVWGLWAIAIPNIHHN